MDPTLLMPFRGATNTTVPYQVPGLMADELPREALIPAAQYVMQQPENQKLAAAIAAVKEQVRREHEAQLQAGGIPGIPIPEPQAMSDAAVAQIMAGPNQFAQTGLGGTRVQAGGRSIGPDLGITGAPGNVPSPSESAPPVNMAAFLQEKGLVPTSTPAPGTPGIGMEGQFFALPSSMRSSETSTDVIRRANEKPYAGPPRQTNQAVLNRAAGKDSARQARMGTGPGAQLLARTDDGGQAGRFAQAALSPRGFAAMSQADAAAAENQLARDNLGFKREAMLPTMLATIAGSMDNPNPQMILKLAQVMGRMVGQGGGQGVPSSVIAGLPKSNPSSIGAPLITATTPEEAVSSLLRAGDMDDAQLKAAYDQVASVLTPAEIETALSGNSVGWLGDALGYQHNTNQMIPWLKGIDTVLGTQFQETPAEFDVRSQKQRLLERLRRVAAGL